ncbi:DUF2589 domain-containing protein [Streptomyces sp. MN13]
MTEATGSLRALPLDEFIGAALSAVVRADAHAARATLDFIEQVGFVRSSDDATVGQLRMAAFGYRKRDENGELNDFTAHIPVLSLLAIPAMEVEDARIAFRAAIVATPGKDGRQPVVTRRTGPTPLVDLLRSRQVDLVARPVSTTGPQGREVRSPYHLDVQLTLKQADIGMGLEKILSLMDQAIDDTQADKQPRRQ